MNKHGKTRAALWAGCWFLAVAALTGCKQAPIEQPVKQPLVGPLIENERVRVIDVLWEPGAGVASKQLAEDSTIGVVGVVVQGGTMEHVQASGEKQQQERRAGDVLWQSGSGRVEARRNVGQTEIRVVQALLKKTEPTGAYQGPVAGAKNVYENPHLVAFDQTFAPGSKSPIHSYGPRVWVILEGGQLRSTDDTGYSEEIFLRPAQWVWLPAQQQILENIGSTPVRAISLELK